MLTVPQPTLMRRTLFGYRMRISTPEEPSSSPERCRARFEVIRPYLKHGGIGAELGVFKGSFTDYLLASAPSKLYLVDPWFRAVPIWPWAHGNQSSVVALTKILEAFQDEIEAQIIEPRIEWSQDFLRTLPNASLDWVYIDSVHTYEQTQLELELCFTKLKHDGFVIGDDYNKDPRAYHTGVFEAVTHWRQAGRLELLVDGPSSQFVGQFVRG